ncbi:unnamed protein product [Lathyrus sativus]|nr:unnamed protein product [Lathyrus sativus]
MDNPDQITAFPSTLSDARGAGGKLRKPPPRKPPASPYTRPSLTANRRWISKLVDPAYRIIAGGATRFLPSYSLPTKIKVNRELMNSTVKIICS